VIIGGRCEQPLSAITAEHPGMNSVVVDVAEPGLISRCWAQVNNVLPLRGAEAEAQGRHGDMLVMLSGAH